MIQGFILSVKKADYFSLFHYPITIVSHENYIIKLHFLWYFCLIIVTLFQGDSFTLSDGCPDTFLSERCLFILFSDGYFVTLLSE